MYNWTDPEKIVSGLKMVKKVSLSGSQAEKAAVIAQYTTNGFACTIAVKNAGHYVAADYVAGSTVYMHDPGSNKTDLFAKYANSGITSIRVFKSTKSSSVNSSDKNTSNNEVNKVTPPKPQSCSHSYNSSGYCSKCGKEYYISLSSMSATYQAVKNDVPVRNRPYSPDKIIRYLAKGTKVNVVASGKNSVGNLWYKLSDGTWIYSENLTKSSGSSSSSSSSKPASSSSSIKISLDSYPKGNLKYGKSFSLSGKFTSDCAITEARAYLLDSNKNVIMEAKGSSNYCIKGYALDKGMKFGSLKPGGYYLKYYIKDANGDTATWISDKFYVVK